MKSHRIRLPGLLAVLASPAGRWFKGLLGLVRMLSVATESLAGVLVALLGLEFLLAAIFDVSVLGPLLGGSFQGDALRQELHNQEGRPQLGDRPASWIRA